MKNKHYKGNFRTSASGHDGQARLDQPYFQESIEKLDKIFLKHFFKCGILQLDWNGSYMDVHMGYNGIELYTHIVLMSISLFWYYVKTI